MRRRCCTGTIAVLVLAGVLGGCSQATSPTRTSQPTTSPAGPGLKVDVLSDELEYPWDVVQLPDGSLLVDEREGKLVRIADGRTTPVKADLSDLYAHGETGLMGLVLDPGFAHNRRFYTCQGNAPAHDIRVIAWTLAPDNSEARRVDDPLVRGLELSSGRHGGCRLLFDSTGALLISAGDAAVGRNAQDLTRLGGKVLRVNAVDGSPAAGNPFLDAENPKTRLIYSYGHRNVQGLALRPGSDQVLEAEHGPDRDDEVNVLRAGGNYGWNPVGSSPADYDESVPMTDPAIKGSIPAVWSSGSSTVAISGAAFLEGEQWGELNGRLAVAALKGEHLMLLDLAGDGTVRSVTVPKELDQTHGRLRAARTGADGALYLTTDNGVDDQVLRVSPASGSR